MAVVDNMAWIAPEDLPQSVDTVKKLLTVVPRERRTRAIETNRHGRDEWVSRVEPPKEPIACWRERENKDGVTFGMPVDWAMANIPNYEIHHEDNTVRGHSIEVPRLPDPNHPNASPGQAEFMDAVNFQTREFYSCLAQAPTGGGKTVTALNAIGHAKRSALVIVPNTVLADQWAKEATKHLGIDPSRIGKVGGGGNRWKDCDIVIAVINSIALIKQEPSFYTHFGFVVWDEAHRLGAQEFSKTMPMFPSRYKLALTATPNRKDGMDKVVFNYFGKPSAIAKSEALDTDCVCIRYPIIGNTDWLKRCRNDMRPMKWLAGLEGRNQMLVNLIYKQYRAGRQIIVLSRFIEHLETLFDMCASAGIPHNAMGPYTGKWKGTTLGKGFLDKVKDNAVIQFATYSKAKEGYDCPRLDCGIEATPVADNVQGIGRIRRPLKGKKKPVWFTILDLNVDLFSRYSNARLRGFDKVNVNIIEQ